MMLIDELGKGHVQYPVEQGTVCITFGNLGRSGTVAMIAMGATLFSRAVLLSPGNALKVRRT